MWEDGGPLIDLNTVIPAGSGLQITNAIDINDRGEILAKSDPLGVSPIDDEDLGHLVLLVPCDEGRGDCVNVLSTNTNLNFTPFVQPNVAQSSTQATALRAWRKGFEARTRRSVGLER